MSFFKEYHGWHVECMMYASINIAIPEASRLFTGLNIEYRFAIGVILFLVILTLNGLRASIGGQLWVIYGVTILGNVISFAFLGTLSYITGAIMWENLSL
jgi:hypothetical protein